MFELDREPEMPNAANEAELFVGARAGSPQALGDLLDVCRRYLLGIANGELDPALRAKVGASDLVQETYLEAQRVFDRFEGTTSSELRAWLRAILLNKIGGCVRHFRDAEKRRVSREVALNSESGSRPEPTEMGPTPSRVMMQSERAAAVTAAIERLPPDYRQVVVWRQMEGVSFEEIATRLGRSLDAVRKLWWRAIQQLQVELGNSL